MTYSEILARLYSDTCTISRPAASEDADGETTFSLSAVYTGVPCRVSRNSMRGSLNATDTTQDLSYDMLLFVAPGVTVEPGDVVAVTRQGNTITYTAGEAMAYSSHVEVPLRREARA